MKTFAVMSLIPLLLGLLSVLLVFLTTPSAQALTTVPTKMNFQGRLTDASGAIKANGTYNMRLKLYTVSTAGTPVWSEDRLVSATQGITLTNGLFAIQLGDITSLPASLFASGPLYLEIELPTPATATSATPTWTEGPMTPRNQLATSAYAYNAETLDGIDSDQLARRDASNTFTGTQLFRNSVDSATAFSIQDAAGANIFVVDTAAQRAAIGSAVSVSAKFYVYSGAQANLLLRQAGASNIIQAQNNTTDVLTVSATGAVVSRNSTNSTAAFIIQTSTSANLFNVDTTGAGIVTIGTSNTTGTLFVLDTKTDVGDPTGVAGAMYYNASASKFRCYQGAAWADCIGAGGGTLQDAYNSSFSPALITTTAAKGVKISAGTVPTTDIFSVDSAGFAVTTDNVNGIDVNYAGGAAAVEGAGIRIDYTPGGTTGGTWSGMRIVSNATGAVSGVTSYGIKLEGPSGPGVGTEVGLRVASGFDIGLDIASGGIQLSSMNDPTTPAFGTLRVYAKSNAGREMLKVKGGSGVDTSLQPFLASNKIGLYQANGNATTATTFGMATPTIVSNAGTTLVAKNVASTNLFASARRGGLSTTATAGTLGSLRLAQSQFFVATVRQVSADTTTS